MIKQILKKVFPIKILRYCKKNIIIFISYLQVTIILPIKRSAGRLIRKMISPKVPTNNKVLIHLGCGDQNHPNFINIDVEAHPHVHYIQDVRRLDKLSDNLADLIYASHVLEHISFRETMSVLHEWRRVLKPGGVLRLSVPDFDILIQAYQSFGNDISKIEEPLLGGQNYEYNFHKNAFNKKRLTELLTKTGFTNIRTWDANNDTYKFNDFAKKFKGSLNLEADKI